MSNQLLTQEVKYSEKDFSKVQINESFYKYSKIVPLNKSSITLKEGATDEITFRITTVPHNISQSFIMYDLTTEAKTEAKVVLNLNLDTHPLLERIKATTETGVPLANLEYLPQYLKVMNPRQTSMKEFLSKDTSEQFYPSGELNTVNQTYAPATGLMHFGTDPISSSNSATAHISENKHTIQAVHGTAATAISQSARTLPFSSIKNSFFSIDKTIQMPVNYTIDVTFGSPNKYVYGHSTDDGKTAEYKDNVTMSNICLYLCTETNQDAVNALNNVMNTTGFSIHCPLVQMSKRVEAKNSQITQTIDISRAQGDKLKRILISPFNPATKAPLCFDNSVNAGVDIVSYYSQFNNKRIQNFDIDVKQNMDWILYRKRHPTGDDAIPTKEYFYRNYCIEEAFDSKGSIINNNNTDGVKLTNEQYTYDLILTTSGNVQYDFYRFVIYEKTLYINKDGVMWHTPSTISSTIAT